MEKLILFLVLIFLTFYSYSKEKEIVVFEDVDLMIIKEISEEGEWYIVKFFPLESSDREYVRELKRLYKKAMKYFKNHKIDLNFTLVRWEDLHAGEVANIPFRIWSSEKKRVAIIDYRKRTFKICYFKGKCRNFGKIGRKKDTYFEIYKWVCFLPDPDEKFLFIREEKNGEQVYLWTGKKLKKISKEKNLKEVELICPDPKDTSLNNYYYGYKGGVFKKEEECLIKREFNDELGIRKEEIYCEKQ